MGEADPLGGGERGQLRGWIQGVILSDCARIRWPFQSDTIRLFVTIDCSGDFGQIWPVFGGAKIRDNRLRSGKSAIAIRFFANWPLVVEPKTAKLQHDARKGKGGLEDGVAGRVGHGHPLVCFRNRGGGNVKPRQLHPRRLTQHRLLALRECRQNWSDHERAERLRPSSAARQLGRGRWHQGSMGRQQKT